MGDQQTKERDMGKTFSQIAQEAREHPLYPDLCARAYREYTTGNPHPVALEKPRADNRFWFYRPQPYWHGWSTLLPIALGHDDYARKTVMLGWTITGRIIIALGDCGEQQCRIDALEYMEDYERD